mgnify:FL=1
MIEEICATFPNLSCESIKFRPPIIWQTINVSGGGFELWALPFVRPYCMKLKLEPFAKQSFRPNSALCSKFYPRDINYMSVVKFLAWFDFERKS